MPTNHNQATITRNVAPPSLPGVTKDKILKNLSKRTLQTVRADSGIAGAGVLLSLPRASSNSTVITTVTPPAKGAATYSISQNFGSPAIAAVDSVTGIVTVSDNSNLGAVSSPATLSVLITQDIGGERHSQTSVMSITLT
jgi:hypothetical protein